MNMFYHEILQELYKKFDIESINGIPALLERYKGREGVLIGDLFLKYAANPIDFDFFKKYIDTNFKEFLSAFYSKHNPDKLKEVNNLVEKFKGKKEVFIKQLCLRYNIDIFSLLDFIDAKSYESRKPIVSDQSAVTGNFYPKKNKATSKYVLLLIAIIIIGISIFIGISLFHHPTESPKTVVDEKPPIQENLTVKIQDGEQITNTTENNEISAINHWMVILGSFKTEEQAKARQQKLSANYQLSTEALYTNDFTKLTKDLYIVVTGKNFSQSEARQSLEGIKKLNLDCYIKDAGEERRKVLEKKLLNSTLVANSISAVKSNLDSKVLFNGDTSTRIAANKGKENRELKPNDSDSDIQFSAQAKAVVAIRETFTLIYTLNAQGSNFYGPNFQGIDKLQGPNTSTSSTIRMVNGKTSMSITYTFTYLLQAIREGTFNIQAATVSVNGKQFTSNSIVIKVVNNN